MLKPTGVQLYNRVNNEDQDLGFHVSPKFKVSASMVRALHHEMRRVFDSWRSKEGGQQNCYL